MTPPDPHAAEVEALLHAYGAAARLQPHKPLYDLEYEAEAKAAILAWHNAELARATKAARIKAIDWCLGVAQDSDNAVAIATIIYEEAKRLIESQPVAENNQPAPQKGERTE